MTPKFIESVSTNVGSAWLGQILTPAFGFWLLGTMAWLWSTNWDSNLTRMQEWLTSPNIEVRLILGAILSLLLVATSSAVISAFSLPALRLLEGQWPRWFNSLRRALIRRQRRIWVNLDSEWQRLSTRDAEGNLDEEGRSRLASIDMELRQYPAKVSSDPSANDELLPTRIGNVLRAAERNPRDRYGLDTGLTWTHLWILVPDSTRSELRSTRNRLDGAVVLLIWTVTSAVWSIFIWWIAIFSVATAWLVYRYFVVPAAQVWADQIQAIFDIDRMRLYKALRMKLPSSPAEDRELGELVSQYILRGTTLTAIHFTTPEPGDDDS